MNFYEKWMSWFKSRPRWLQITLVIGLSVLLVVGIWANSTTFQSKSSAEEVDSSSWMLTVFLSFVLVILLIVGLGIVARRWMSGAPRGNNRQMQVVETLILNPKRSLHIVQVGEQLLLIGATDQNINLISELDSSNPPTGGFPAVFQNAIQENTTKGEQ